MANYLRQATAASILLGPFLDDVDARSAETGLTIIPASVYVSKRGSAPSAMGSQATASHITLGYYRTILDTTDTASAGDLVILTSPSGALPVWREFNVLAPSAYDSLVLGASTLPTTIIANGIIAGAFAASSITATAFAGSAINAPVIGSSVILPTTIKTGAVTADAIAACAFTNAKFAGSAIASTNFAACAIIPFGIRSHSLPGGVLRGAGLGLAAGSSLISALRGLIPPQDFARYAATYSLAMVALTTAVALLFAYLAQRRRRMMEDSWS